MTCIVGVVGGDGVFIGGDSAGVSSRLLRVRADAKVFRKGAFVFGFTTSFRMGQLLRYSLDVPPPPPRDLPRYMSTTFIDAVRQCLQTGGFAAKEHETETGGDFLVGCCGRLFMVASDYQVGEAAAGYDAVGAGAEIALGALEVTRGQKPRARIRLALRAAERWNTAVRSPFLIVRTPLTTPPR